MNGKRSLLLILVVALAACAGPRPASHYQMTYYGFDPAKDPYWQDPSFAKSLLAAVQSAVHDPVDPADLSTPGLRGTVKFMYVNGVIEYPDIVQSTGHPDLDKLMLHQIAEAQVPKPVGLQNDQPHEFVLELYMPTPFEAFQAGIYAAIDVQKVYPKEAVLGAHQGNATVDFDYQDGKTSNISMARSSDLKDLDKAALNAVTRAIVPPAPPLYAGKLLHMEAVFCYSLRGSDEGKDPCPAGRDVIEVTGTRIMRVDIQRVR
jgi:TonB family protein